MKYWSFEAYCLNNFLIETLGNSCLLYSVKRFRQTYSVIFFIWIFIQELFEFVSVEVTIVSMIQFLKWFSERVFFNWKGKNLLRTRNVKLVLRSSNRRCSELEILQNSQGHTCARVSFLINLQVYYQKKRLWHRCFPASFAKLLRTPFLQNSFGQLLLFSFFLGLPSILSLTQT